MTPLERAAHRDSYRLTGDDETTIREALAETLASWNEHRPPRNPIPAAELVTLERLAAHRIGCTVDDLRGPELAWIDSEAERINAR